MDRLFRIDFYPQDWLIDTARLSPEDRGIYIQIICLIYSNRGPIINDPNWVAGISGCSKTVAKNAISRLLENGFLRESQGKLGQKRTENELKSKQNHFEMSQKGGINSGVTRNKNNDLTRSEQRSTLSTPSPSPSPIATEERKKEITDIAAHAFELFCETAQKIGIPIPSRLTPVRKNRLLNRLGEAGGIDGWKIALAKLESSDFCSGRKTEWKANFDFMLQQGSFTKLMEGNYDNRKGKKNAKSIGDQARDLLDELRESEPPENSIGDLRGSKGIRETD